MPEPINTKPYRRPDEMSGPAVGCVAALLISICIFALAAVLGRLGGAW